MKFPRLSEYDNTKMMHLLEIIVLCCFQVNDMMCLSAVRWSVMSDRVRSGPPQNRFHTYPLIDKSKAPILNFRGIFTCIIILRS